MNTPDVSVIVPCYNAISTIDRCLQALRNQIYEYKYEVIVVDSSSDGTGEKIIKGHPWVKVIQLDKQTYPGSGRNIGVMHARGSIVLCTDTDCIVPEDWIAHHVRLHEEWDAIGGAIGNANHGNLIGWASYLSEFSGFTPCNKQRRTRHMITANVSYKRNIFDKFRFDDELRTAEDVVLHRQISATIPCLFDGTLVIGHINRTSLKAFFANKRLLGHGSAVARRKYNLGGQLLIEKPFLLLFTPFYRFFSNLCRIARDTPRYLPYFVLTAPLIFLGYVVWARGFMEGSHTVIKVDSERD